MKPTMPRLASTSSINSPLAMFRIAMEAEHA